MISIHDRASMRDALARPLDAELHSMLAAKAEHLATCAYGDLTELTHILVIEPGDAEADIQEAIGLTPLVNPLDGSRFGEPWFLPWWDWLERRGDWFELIVSVGNSGFAYVLLISDAMGVSPDLLALCRTYAE